MSTLFDPDEFQPEREEREYQGSGRDHPLARNTDPATSHLADAKLRQREGDANEVRYGTKRYLALECFVVHGDLTPEDVGVITAQDGIWKRVSDLKRDGFVEPTGATRISRQGREAEIYRLTDQGRAAAYRAIRDRRRGT